ncbi:peptidase domain-containing ABC transporter [Chitinophaga flava]|uniref:ABC transporter ATP-binding protein n=1 Tax=Chitinophaga flava TaxID=2259036 RepID=A0A365XXR5_9BACT|nr:peptidase domain-containing ABC transporter [Chitinophaga flava]RBL91137.1 ABC transporter ATP-binding protein [Chitinophaga flava]
MGFTFYKQLDTTDCGPTCLRMIARYYGKNYSMQLLRQLSSIGREGVSLLGLGRAAEKIGFRSMSVKITFEQLDEEAPLPCILYWNQQHFVVLPPQNYSGRKEKGTILVADPAHGMVRVNKETFLKSWLDATNGKGIALLLAPSELGFLEEEEEQKVPGFKFLLKYLSPHRKHILQLFLAVFFGSLLSLIFPFLTQGLVDYGVNRRDVSFVYLILISQLSLSVGNMAIDFIRGWIMLHMNSRLTISILSDFLRKLMKLPVSYFDTKLIGDIRQRITDHQRIQSFLTGSALSTVFSFVNLFVYIIVLFIYNWKLLLVYAAFSTAGICWIVLFLKYRKELDYQRFQRLSQNENLMYEMISGMQEVKLNTCETSKLWEWERLQVKMFKVSIKSLTLGQYQQVGSVVFNQIKNILISFISAKAVIDGHMTLGMMMSVSYIIGQLNSPVEQLLGFIQSAQDAKLSLERLGDVHSIGNEETENNNLVPGESALGDIMIRDVSFQYEGELGRYALQDVSMVIPKGKITAIVGESGSGKTTLMKILLKFYQPQKGEIRVGDTVFSHISPTWWRARSGAVMQDGFVFSGTIAENICLSEEEPDRKKLRSAIHIANLDDFIETAPLGTRTKIGTTGSGISAGQKQRLQIARAVYKDPAYLFFDEATSHLDTTNEKIIMQHMNRFYTGRTVVVIAHRLSTVRNADQIVVLHKGKVVETGTHEELVGKRGYYFNLVKDQLELVS